MVSLTISLNKSPKPVGLWDSLPNGLLNGSKSYPSVVGPRSSTTTHRRPRHQWYRISRPLAVSSSWPGRSSRSTNVVMFAYKRKSWWEGDGTGPFIIKLIYIYTHIFIYTRIISGYLLGIWAYHPLLMSLCSW